MKFMPLIWSGVWRHPSRTLLVLLQIGVAFTLFGLLNGMNSALKLAVDKQRADVLYVSNRVRGDSVPLRYAQQIRAVPGVASVGPRNYLVGEYQNPRQQVIAVATDLAHYFEVNTYTEVAADRLQEAQKTRTAAIAGAELVRRYGWKIGDRVPLRSDVPRKDGSSLWTFDIVGVYDYPEESDMTALLIVNNDYLDQARAELAGTADNFVVKISAARDAPRISDAIDNLFVNSAFETSTISENESAQIRLRSMGELDLVARAVTIVAFLALLLSVGTMLVYSIRQRTPELGVLKALGFADRTLVMLIVLEVMGVTLSGALLGLGAAWQLLPLAREYAGLVHMPAVVVGAGMGCAVLLALASAWLPSRHAVNLRVVQALAKP